MDYGQRVADKAQDEVEARLKAVYQAAYDDLKKEFESFTERHKKADEKKRKLKDDGMISEADYQNWRRGQEFIGKQWQSKIDAAAKILQNASSEALKVVNGQQHDVYAENANWTAYSLEKDANMQIGFGVYDADAVGNLLRNQPELLPRKVINKQKQDAWCQKEIANAVAQGIIEGDPIDKIAKRIAQQTSSSGMKAMVRYARTAMTGAQNAGRMDTLHRATGMGIRVKKQWLATLDRRTRHSHQMLDGQVRDIDKPFESIFGRIMFPGDLDADNDADIWNCRCTMTYVYPDFSDLEVNVERYDQEEGKPIADMSYQEWRDAYHPDWKKPKTKQKQPEPQEPQNNTVSLDEIKKRLAEHQGEWATDELISVGGDIAALVEQDVSEKIKAIEDEKQTVLARLKELEDNNDYSYEWATLYDKKFELLGKKSHARAGALYEALQKIREFGGVTKKTIDDYADFNAYKYKKSAVKENELQALNYYPTAWLELSQRHGIALKPHWSTGRAYYSPNDGEIRVSDRIPSNIHELGHRMECCVPGILKAEREFYEKRTAGYDLEWLGEGYDSGEKSRKDKFTNPYMGKDYGGKAYELVSMGFEAVLAPEPRHKLDDEMRDWILGILAAI